VTAGAGAGARPATALPDAVPAAVMRVAVVPEAVLLQGAGGPQDALAVPQGVVPVAAAARDVVPHHGAVPARVAQAAVAARAVQSAAVAVATTLVVAAPVVAAPVVTAPVVAEARADPQAALPAAGTLASPTPSAE
jgi:hypothetical protein